ncbi:MAG: FG-GAP-like repeat-containing protein, partial [Imperialibacter sp.]|uniref:FG-GAP-like repeat-containing protein n=1 Tax=Imperialibacter sp. TaxID=2038411 RepID=UPI0032EC0EDF
MPIQKRLFPATRILLVACVILLPFSQAFSQMSVSTTTPFVNETNIVASDDIILIFDATLDGTTLNATNIRVMGSRSGLHSAVYSGGGTTSLTINPDVDFFAGEKVTVTITDGVLALSTQAAVPYTLSFTIETGPFEGAFIKQSTNLEGVVDGSASWADYDGDGDFDVVVSGWDFEYGAVITKIFSNSGSNFEDIGASLSAAYEGSVDWGDYDNDGDLDLFLTGYGDTEGVPIAILYNNNSGTFEVVSGPFQGVYNSEADWGDFDNDGDLDLIVQGLNSNGGVNSTNLYRNDAGTFVNHNAGLTAVDQGGVAWGDYDNDGDLDLVSSGNPDSGPSITTIYRNDGGVFTDIVAGLEGKSFGKVAWGDYDNDGDLDLIVSGSGVDNAPIIYRNDAGSFVDSNAGLLENAEGEFAWGDYDGDGDLDLVINGSGETNDPTTTIYINNSGTYVNSGIKVDNYLYSTADWGDYDNDGDLDLLMTGTDDFNGGRIALYMNTIAPPAIYNATNVTAAGFTPNLVAPPGAVDLLVDVSTDPAFGSFLPSGQDISVGILGGVDIAVTLTPGTQYFYRAKTDFGGGTESTYYVSNGFMVKQGNALTFTGTQYVETFDNLISAPAGDFTIEFWFKTNATGNRVFIERGTSELQYSIQQLVTTNQIGLIVNGGTMKTNGSYNDGRWHQVAVVYRGSNDGTIYVDGIDDTDTGSNTLGIPAYAFGRLNIGDRRFGGTFNIEGSIDEVRIWDDERTLTEINDFCYAKLTGAETGLLVYYRFDETTGLVLPDLSGNGLNGDLNNMAGTEWVTSYAGQKPFVTTWVTSDGTITVPTTGSGYNYDITWANLTTAFQGDGLITGQTGDYQITGLTNGDTYQIEITGDFPRIYFNSGAEKDKITTIEQWGDIVWTSMESAFLNCTNLTYNATDAPDLTNVTSLDNMFSGATSFNGDIGNWNISSVASMANMLDNTAISTANFDATLTGWAAQTPMSFVTLGANGLTYCEATSAYMTLTSGYGWSISDAGQLCPPKTIYVNNNASGLNNGTSWIDAYTDLQDALSVAVDGDQIWVANGVYRPDGINAGNTSLSFVITQNDLSIFGGFDGTEGSLGERYADPSQTVLSGDLNGDDDFNFSFISDNSNNVVIVSNVTGVYLDGLTISGGNAAGDGGGIYSSTAEFSINNVFVEYNYAGTSGGGAYITGTSVTVLNSHFQNNQATTGGGAYLLNSEPFIYRSVFQYNEAVSGGGLYMNGSNLVDNSVSYYNKFLNNGTTATTGGGIYLQESYFEAFQNLFAGNFAYDYGGAIVVDALSTSIVVNSTIADNASNDGSGALNFFVGATVQVDNSIFWGNTSVAQAGSLKNFNDGGAFTIQNSIVEDWDNTAYAAETESNIYLTDPLFINSANQDYHLLLASPAIDAGDNFVLEQPFYIDIFDEDQNADFLEYAPYDLGKSPRYYNFTVDLGAFEHQGNPDPLLFSYVDVNAVGNNDGSTWADAFTDLQSALAAAVDGSQIWVAAGTYYPSGDDPSVSFVIPSGTSVYGGFNGTESSLSQRDPEANITILDGDSPNFLNSYLVVYIGGSGNNAWLDGFTVRGGSGEFGTDNYGGGIKIEGGADPILANLIIQLNQNDFGAGLYAANSSVTIENSAFLSNSVTNFGTGGAIYADNAIIKISNSYFNNNTAWEAGGIYLSNGSSLLAVSVDFDTNSAFGLNGGAIGSLDSDISLTNGRFYNNSGNPGAGIYFKSASSDHSVILTQTTFTTSSSSDGVAVVSSGGFVSSAVISNSILWANAGSQINIIDDGSNLDISNSVVDSWNIGDYSGFAGTINAANISVADPLFTSPGTGDLSIQSGSSAQDFGDISFLPLDDLDVDNDANTVEVLPLDLAGNPRISNAQVDAGAYEIQVGPGPFVVTANNGEIPLAAVNNGTSDVVLGGLAVNITTGTTLTRAAFTSNVDLSKSFQNYRLYHSVDEFFSTSGDNVLLSSSPFLSITDIEFQSFGQVLIVADHYLFLVADTKIEANPTQPGISFGSSELGLDFSTGTLDPFTYSGPTITFKAGPIFSATIQNNTGSNVTVGIGSLDIVLLEALIAANQYAELTAITYNFSEDPQANLENFKLVISTDNSLTTTGDNVNISPAQVTAGNASFDLTNEPLYAAGKYFFFIADSRADATGTGTPLTFSMDDASLSVAFGLVTGISVISDPLVVTTVVTPTAPTGLTLAKNSTNDVTGNFPTSGAEGYVVIRRLTSSAAYLPQNGIALTQGTIPAAGNFIVQVSALFSFTDTGLATATDYTYEVYAYNGSGVNTIYSLTSATSSILTYPNVPSAVSGLVVSKDKANAVTGSFAGSGAAGYVVLRKLSSAGSYTPVAGTPLIQGSAPSADNIVVLAGAGTSFTDTGLLTETDYTYEVYAYNGSGAETVYSVNPVTSSILTYATTPVEQATGLVLTQSSANVISGAFTVSADASGYLVLRRLTGVAGTAPLDGTAYAYNEVYSQQFVVQSGGGLSFSDTVSVAIGEELFYDVFSYNGTGATINYNVVSPLAGSIVVQTLNPRPAVLPASNVTTYSFTANWSSLAGVDAYRLEVATDGLFAIPLTGYNPLETTDTTVVITGLYHATSYFLRVKAFTGTVETNYSDTLEVKTLKSDELTSDSTALVKIYDQMGGAGWSSSGNWKVSQVRGWAGVAVTNSRVSA